ncbi:TPA: hypothetical protein DCX16_04150 [bacterium]|nr:hypothetical protein [bacterium]
MKLDKKIYLFIGCCVLLFISAIFIKLLFPFLAIGLFITTISLFAYLKKTREQVAKLSLSLEFTEQRLDEERKLREEFFHKEFSESDFLITNFEENYYKLVVSMIYSREAQDYFAKGHSEKTAEYARKIAEELSLSKKEIALIEKCALLHDVGRIGVPEALFNKPDVLNDEEFEIIKSHAVRSEYIASPISSIYNGLSYIRNHHERFNGTGYPDRLKGDEIPLGARIIAVADAYSAMTARRPYRKSLKPEIALEELRRNAGKQHDPKIIQALLNIVARESPELDEELMMFEIE